MKYQRTSKPVPLVLLSLMNPVFSSCRLARLVSDTVICSPAQCVFPEHLLQPHPAPMGSSIPSSRVTSDVSQISIPPPLPHPNNPELWVRSHKSRSLVHRLMRHWAENTTSCLIPGPLLTVTALAFAQQRLTRCSCCKRASIFHTIVFSVLEGKGELCGSAVLQRGQLPQLLALWPMLSPIPKAQPPQSSGQHWIAGARGRAVLRSHPSANYF